MEAVPKPGDPINLKKLSDRELASLLLGEPTDNYVEEELCKRCLNKITAAIKAYSVVPDFLVDDVISETQENIHRGIRKLRSAEALDAWLRKLVRNAAFTILRKCHGRGKQPQVFFSIDEDQPQEEPGRAPDRETWAASDQGYATFRSRYWRDPEQLVMNRELRDLLLAAFHIHGQGTRRDADCAIWMESQLSEGVSVEEIAKARGSTKDDVWHLFSHDQKSILHILTETFHVTVADLP